MHRDCGFFVLNEPARIDQFLIDFFASLGRVLFGMGWVHSNSIRILALEFLFSVVCQILLMLIRQFYSQINGNAQYGGFFQLFGDSDAAIFLKRDIAQVKGLIDVRNKQESVVLIKTLLVGRVLPGLDV